MSSKLYILVAVSIVPRKITNFYNLIIVMVKIDYIIYVNYTMVVRPLALLVNDYL